MSHLLLSDTFDNFLFIEGEIVTFNTFTIDGFIQKSFYESEEEAGNDYALWKQLRELCFSMIRGKRTPLSFKFVFSLSPRNIAKLLQQKNLDYQPGDVQGLYLNMDKSLEREWDAMVPRFFDQKGIPFDMEE